MLLVAWGGFSITGFLLGGLFHPHYFVGLIAPFSALAALGVRRIARARGGRVAAAVTVVLLAVPAVATWPVDLRLVAVAGLVAHLHDRRMLTDRRSAPGSRRTRLRASPCTPCTPRRACTSTPTGRRRTSTSGSSACSRSRALSELRDMLAGPRAPRYIVVYQAPRTMPGAVAAGIPSVLARRYHLVTRVAHHDVLELR